MEDSWELSGGSAHFVGLDWPCIRRSTRIKRVKTLFGTRRHRREDRAGAGKLTRDRQPSQDRRTRGSLSPTAAPNVPSDPHLSKTQSAVRAVQEAVIRCGHMVRKPGARSFRLLSLRVEIRERGALKPKCNGCSAMEAFARSVGCWKYLAVFWRLSSRLGWVTRDPRHGGFG